MAKKSISSGKRQIQVVLSPGMIPLYELENKTAVIIDILRATSSMCVAFQEGAEQIMPVETVAEASSFKIGKFLCAGERDGQKLDGFDFGNSPFDYLQGNLKGKTIVMTTTNGTQAINQSKFAKKVVIGSFLNIDILCEWLATQPNDILLVCSGWKNKFNLEDTLFAGAVVNRLKDDYDIHDDAAIMANTLWEASKDDLVDYILKASHAQRFERLGIQKDIEYCLQMGIIRIIPELNGTYLTPMKKV
jgi:2-phosphosulfolactate phosphatase